MSELFNASAYLTDRQIERGYGDRTAVTGPLGTLTYRELARRTAEGAAGWRGAGLRPEERVLIFAADSPDMLVALLATMRCGAVPVPVSTMSTAAELTHLLRDSRARFLLAGPGFAPVLRQALAQPAALPDLSAVVTLDDAPVQPPARLALLRWEHLLTAGAHGTEADLAPDRTTEDSPALWLYTSGTTGTPKAAMHRHGSIRHVAETYGRQVLGIGPEDRCYSVARLFFAYGLGNSCFLPLSSGAATVLDPARPTPRTVLRRLAQDAPTLFFGVPTSYAALLRTEEAPADAFRGVRVAVSAGEPLPTQLQRDFLRHFGVPLLNGLGSTEALHIFLSDRPGRMRPGTLGTPVPGYTLRLTSEDGGEPPDGTPGVLRVRAPSAATGYWARPEATRRVFQGEWIDTGDLFVRDAEGCYTCLGRADDMIKSGGIWVSPAEVENRLLEHPSVAAAVVVSAPDRDGLGRPVACVVPAEGHTIDADGLIAFCRAKLASFKCPRHVLGLPDLPVTGTGKTNRGLVREQALARLRDHGQAATAAPENTQRPRGSTA
ncbi:benzoate-CoA ligase family protein [Streptomyces acidiscabies]|uniref:benzoate-CoA ligase family protein n=1 Tax=Streptomyces acidiscabies TaxID=42234 RepID=UPI0038F786DA